jgi:hypothetical protein
MTFLRCREDSGSKRSIEHILKYPRREVGPEEYKVIMKRHLSIDKFDPV